MSRIVRNSIYYDGINDYIPSNVKCFTNQNTHKLITLNEEFPSLDDILKVKAVCNLKNKKIVKTAKGISLEGQILTGLKLISEGEFVLRIEYMSEELNGCIYTFREIINTTNLISLNEEHSISNKLVENIYIEDIYIEKIDERHLIVNITYIFAIEDY